MTTPPFPIRPDISAVNKAFREGNAPPLAPQAPIQDIRDSALAPTLAQPARHGYISPAHERYMMNQVASIFDRGGDEKDAQQFVDRELKRPLSTKPVTIDNLYQTDPDVPTWARGMSMAMLQGATFGWGDEGVGAFLGYATGVGARAGIDQYRAEYEAWGKEHKYSKIAGELLGTLLLGGISLESFEAREGINATRAVAGAVRDAYVARVAASASGPGLFRLAAQGAAAGAIAGAGYSDNAPISERVDAALSGAGWGATAAFGGLAAGKILAPVARPVGKAISNALPRRVQQFFGIGPEVRAMESIAQATAQGGIDDVGLETIANDMRAQGVPVTLVDMVPEVADLTRDAAKQMSPTRARMMQDAKERLGGQGERLSTGFVTKALTTKELGLANAYKAAKDLHKRALELSKPFYEQSYEQVVKLSPELTEHLDLPLFRKAYNLGAEQARIEDAAGRGHGLGISPLPDVLNQEAVLRAQEVSEASIKAFMAENPRAALELPVRGIDYMKQNMRDALNILLAEGKPIGRKGSAKLAYNDLLKQFVNEARTQVPAFGTALDIFGGHEETRAAINAGRKFLDANAKTGYEAKPHQIDAYIRSLHPAQRDFYRIGVGQRLYEDAISLPHDAAAKAVFGGIESGRDTFRAQQLRAMFPDAPQAANEFVRQVQGEMGLSMGTGRLLGAPSAVGVQQVEEAAHGAVPRIRATLGVAILAAGREAFAKFTQKMSRAEADKIMELATQGMRDPLDLSVLIKDIHHTYQRLGWTREGATRFAQLTNAVRQTTLRGKALRAAAAIGAGAAASMASHTHPDESVEPDIERR